MRIVPIMAVLLMIASGCATAAPVAVGGDAGESEDAVASPTLLESSPSDLPSSSSVPTTTAAVVALAADPVDVAQAPVTAVFEWKVVMVGESNRSEVASTWRPECPVALEDLRLLELSHWDYEGRSVTGRLVIHRDHIDAVVSVFGRLHANGFPIERMELIDEYGGDDQASMAANNTSAFNCREISGSPGVWSQHAYGGAIDINPLVNPWVQGSQVAPAEGEPYADRGLDVPGLITLGDVVTEAFAAVGWGWGGDWTSSKDYQHFSWNGR